MGDCSEVGGRCRRSAGEGISQSCKWGGESRKVTDRHGAAYKGRDQMDGADKYGSGDIILDTTGGLAIDEGLIVSE